MQPPLSVVTDIQVRNWASEVVLICLDDPSTRRTYELVFRNCREFRWTLDDSAPSRAEAVEADIIGFHPGQENYLDPALLTTDIFELSVRYERLEIRDTAADSTRSRRRELASTSG